MADFSRRSPDLELMDDPGVPAPELEETLEELAVVNRLLGGYATSLDAIAALLPPGRREFSLLDVGCGGGDTARRIADWARQRGLEARVRAIDLSEASVAFARRRHGGAPGLAFETADLFALPEGETYDIVHAALVLHHFPGDSASAALKRMYAASRLGLVVNDLDRHPVAYHSIRLLTRALSRNRLIRHDAPLSVLRAFKRGCLRDLAREAGLPEPEVRWRWAFRWAMTVRR